MKKYIKVILIGLFILYCFTNFTFACSFNEFIKFEFNPQEFVFFGQVTGYTDKVENIIEINNQKIKFSAVGLNIQINDKIHLPIQTEFIEVFPTSPVDTACTPSGASKDELKKGFPIGTKVRVIGQENPKLLQASSSSVPRVQVTGGNQGQLFNNVDSKGNVLTTSASIFDYKLSLPLYGTKHTYAETFVWLFEIRKDLKRLKQTNSQTKRFDILKRLAYAYDNYQDYGKLLNNYLQDEKKRKELLTLKRK
ncbi:MAG: hypothetical protein ACR2MD_06175 [Aridibacter sp.]